MIFRHAHHRIRFRAVALPRVLSACVLLTVVPLAHGEVDFVRDVRPILADTCYKCHGPDEAARTSEIRFDLRESALADHDGVKAIVPGKPAASELVARILHDDPEMRMPPSDSNLVLSRQQKQTLKDWIAQGADWPNQKHWSFVRPERHAIPPRQFDGDGNAIDRFVGEVLVANQKQPSNPAARGKLLRRIAFDLTGLPPTAEDLDRFAADQSPDALDKMVDRFLASPRHGEHMARPWLDAARYADTDGYQNDRYRYMWGWRDWVILALNGNMPFDQFTIEQLAGDMLPDATLFQQIATGFCRNHRINSEAGSIAAEWHAEYVSDRVDTLGTVWLGLTVGCARCHDHKYDPISQRDYYELFAYFNNVPEWGTGPNNGNSPPFIKLPETWPNLTPDDNRLIVPAEADFYTTQGAVVRPRPGDEGTIMVMAELDKPRATHLLRRGVYNDPDKSEVLAPAVPNILGSEDALPGNRLELAQWLVSDENPVTARVIANRFWQHFFHTGIVRTSENFGVQGEFPSHPKLLDWLATELVRKEWDMKQFHRLIVSSATYRQNSQATPEAAKADPDNRLLARGPRTRLSAHAIRDSALAVSGLLVEEIGGPSVKPYMPKNVWKAFSNNRYVQDEGSKLFRRSIYTYWRRTIPPPTMMTFGAAERETCIVRKDDANTPLQALTLMNNVTFVEAARKLPNACCTSPAPIRTTESTTVSASRPVARRYRKRRKF